MNESKQLLAAIFVSIIVPGLGQMMQKRFRAALEFFVVLGVSILLFYLWGLWAFVFHVPLMLYASLDVVLRMQKESTALHRAFGFLLCAMILAFALAPAVNSTRKGAYHLDCHCQFKQLAIALHDYHQEHKSLPPAYTVDADGKPLHSWRVLILPYIEEKELYDKIRLNEPWDSEYNRQFHDIFVAKFDCLEGQATNPLYKKFPAMKKAGNCYVSVVVGERTAFPGSKTISFADIHDMGDTILLVERLTPICWMDPNSEIRYENAVLGVNKDFNGLGGFHKPHVCCTTAFADGAIVSLPDDTLPEILKTQLTIFGK